MIVYLHQRERRKQKQWYTKECQSVGITSQLPQSKIASDPCTNHNYTTKQLVHFSVIVDTVQ